MKLHIYFMAQPLLVGTAKVMKLGWLSAWQRTSNGGLMWLPCHVWFRPPGVACLGEAFNIDTTWGYWIDGKFLMNNLCTLQGVLLLGFPRKVLSTLPLPILGRYLYLLVGLPYALEVVIHIKKPKNSLWDSETFLKHLALYVLGTR